MNAREFLEWAIEDYDLEDALRSLGDYLGKGTHFVQFPDADVRDQDGNPLEDSLEEPAGFQEYWEKHQELETQIGPGRPALPESERRKPRSVRMTDAEWEEIQRRADALGLPISEFIRLKTLVAGD